MNILSIETSCDETAVSIVEASGDFPNATYEILGDALLSQAEIHSEYGGVFPNVAKREHALTLVPLLEKALTESKLEQLPHSLLLPEKRDEIQAVLKREHTLAEKFLSFLLEYNTPDIDLIAVTNGPGLEPALWVGVNFAKALSIAWDVPVVGVNHMEGHILSSLFDGKRLSDIAFPALALLISGGHTELVLMKGWGSYEKIGQTKDDAVGEAFDKTARMLGLPYPGGPQISKLAEYARENNVEKKYDLPRPMIGSGTFDFSFSGLKTAVLYKVKDENLTKDEKADMAREFEDAVTDVLLKKTFNAVREYGIKSLVLGGGVTANTHIRRAFEEKTTREHDHMTLYLPNPKLSTDNAVMIAFAAHAKNAPIEDPDDIRAEGNLSISTR